VLDLVATSTHEPRNLGSETMVHEYRALMHGPGSTCLAGG
jgi:hypothetical protein